MLAFHNNYTNLVFTKRKTWSRKLGTTPPWSPTRPSGHLRQLLSSFNQSSYISNVGQFSNVRGNASTLVVAMDKTNWLLGVNVLINFCQWYSTCYRTFKLCSLAKLIKTNLKLLDFIKFLYQHQIVILLSIN